VQTTEQIQTGAASYPPAYNAPGARLDRAYPRYIKARVRDDKALANLSRAVIDSTIDAAVRGA
jgi:hypothetical protein